jgi:hypothetical protein
MKTSATRSYKSLMQSLSKWMMFFAAVLLCIAGRIIHDLWDIQRQLAYMEASASHSCVEVSDR